MGQAPLRAVAPPAGLDVLETCAAVGRKLAAEFWTLAGVPVGCGARGGHQGLQVGVKRDLQAGLGTVAPPAPLCMAELTKRALSLMARTPVLVLGAVHGALICPEVTTLALHSAGTTPRYLGAVGPFVNGDAAAVAAAPSAIPLLRACLAVTGPPRTKAWAHAVARVPEGPQVRLTFIRSVQLADLHHATLAPARRFSCTPPTAETCGAVGTGIVLPTAEGRTAEVIKPTKIVSGAHRFRNRHSSCVVREDALLSGVAPAARALVEARTTVREGLTGSRTPQLTEPL